ncbi:hypothetical protein NUU61_006405 [Penicillium alfredii]|uniref:Uncharacterized protein n=1 Tax=Penicillium alfredii TaxID=1506179 RepID=A0A9W9F0W8_9EURO|nr:uncharacterized protein NUU61_006405 [Penicillium alfredii]KAJ5091535.1 hypothetical protein NUU61_006405 [Penicillium alfredii]
MDKKSQDKPTEGSPPTSASDVLRPLSQHAAFPNSGSVATKAREQRHSPGPSAHSSNTTGTGPRANSPSVSHPVSHDTATTSVQKRSESVQQMHEVDADGVRTWRRLIVEYR